MVHHTGNSSVIFGPGLKNLNYYREHVPGTIYTVPQHATPQVPRHQEGEWVGNQEERKKPPTPSPSLAAGLGGVVCVVFA